jgi:hypothetical protein
MSSQRLRLYFIISMHLIDAFSLLPPKTQCINKHNLSTSNNEADNSKRSIGDVTNNLHGGKYQFQQAEQSLLAGTSRIGQEFADSLYSSCDGADCEEEMEMPKWALRMSDPSEHIEGIITDTLSFVSDESIVENTVTITNEERSWERFHLFIFPWDGGKEGNVLQVDNRNDACPFATNINTGVLAPRGGASNACDANKPYSDSDEIIVTFDGGKNVGDYLLVVGTGAEVWRYLLKIE